MTSEKDSQLWFTHDCNAKDDPKIILLIDELGLEGFGIFWVLIETLRAQKGYKLQLKAVDALARRYNTTSQKMHVVIKSYDLFTIDGEEFFFSPSLLRRMQIWDEKKKLAIENGKKGAQIKKEKIAAQETQLLGFSPDDSTKGGFSNPQAITQKNNKEHFTYNTTQTIEEELDEFFEYIMQNSKEPIRSRNAYKIKLKELYNHNDSGILNDFNNWRQAKADLQETNLLISLKGLTINYNNSQCTILGVEKINQNTFKIFFTNNEIYHCTAREFYRTFKDFYQKSAS